VTPLSTLASRKHAKKQLAELESLDVDSAEFETSFQALPTDVLQHADNEEQREFSQLAGELEPDQLNRMRRAVRLAEASAPTRPHAGVEWAKANLSGRTVRGHA
jgi:hypothetical protein